MALGVASVKESQLVSAVPLRTLVAAVVDARVPAGRLSRATSVPLK